MPTTSTHDDLKKLCERSITKMSDADALLHIGQLIDKSLDALYGRGAKRALNLLDTFSKRELTEAQGALVEYFRANARAALSKIAGLHKPVSWESQERQDEMLSLSRAVSHDGFSSLEKIRQCQILTNYANLLNAVGRTIDALPFWESALKISPRFAMAQGNRGCGLFRYFWLMEHPRDRAILALHAFDGLKAACSADAIHESEDPLASVEYFSRQARIINGGVDIESVRARQNLEQGFEGSSKVERSYRRWCLEHRLFLSPLNDLGPHLAAAVDDLVLPSMIESIDDRPDGHLPPPILGYFSQMKQEYVSARFMLFEGTSSTQTHFSDRSVVLTNTLDYPLYSLSGERIRSAFRIAYSLLDKVAFLVDHYWKLNKDPSRISFKNVWMGERTKIIHPQLQHRDNLPLLGLFWLSKELFDPDLKQTTAIDARDLHSIRNALEHTYLRVIHGWAKPFLIKGNDDRGLGITIGSDQLESKALRVMKIARSALFYVSLAIGVEEREKRRNLSGQPIGTMPLYVLDQQRKRRDPS